MWRRAAPIDLAAPGELGRAPRPRQRIGAAQSLAQWISTRVPVVRAQGSNAASVSPLSCGRSSMPASRGSPRPAGRPRPAPRRPRPAAHCRARRGSAAAAAWTTRAAGGSRTAGRSPRDRPRSPARRPRRTSRRPRAAPRAPCRRHRARCPPAPSAPASAAGGRGTPAFWLKVESERNSVQSSRSNVNSGDFGRAGRLAEAPAGSGGFFNPRGAIAGCSARTVQLPDQTALRGMERVAWLAAIGLVGTSPGAGSRPRSRSGPPIPRRAAGAPAPCPGSGPTGRAGSSRTAPSPASPSDAPAPPSRPGTARHRRSAAARRALGRCGAAAWR